MRTGKLLFLRSLFLGLSFILYDLPSGRAQTSTPPRFSNALVTHFNDEDGLMSNDITGIAEDVHGYIWIATQNGIARYDGKYFKLYTQANTPSLTSNRIRSLGTDFNGTIFFTDANNNVSYITPDETIKPFPGAEGKDFVFGLYGFFLDMRPYVKTKTDSIRMDHEFYSRGVEVANTQFYSVGKESAYFVGSNLVSFFDKGQFSTIMTFPYHPSNKTFFVNGGLFIVDPRGIISGYYKGKNFRVKESFPNLLFENNKSLSFDINKADFCSNKTGSFLQYGDSVYTITLKEDRLVLKPVVENLGLPRAKDIYYSAINRLYFFRTAGNGLYVVKNNPFIIQRSKSNDLFDNNFKAAVELKDSSVLTSKGIIFRVSTQEKKFPKGFFNERVIFKDNSNNIWYVHADSIYCADDNLIVQKKWIDPHPFPVAFTQDMQGAVWHASSQKLMKIENGGLSIEYNNQIEVVTECIFPISDSCLWMGTTQGLLYYNYKSKKLTNEPELIKNDVRTIYRAKDGSIWLGTYGQGFYCYRNGKFYQMPLDRHGYLSSTHSFIEDDNGFFWISTNKGLFQVLKKDLDAFVENKTQTVYYYYYDRSDGLITNEFNGDCSPAGIRLQDGTLSFPSLNGLVWFKPPDIHSILPDRNIYIDEITVNDKQISHENVLEFEAGSHQISFSISTPYFGNQTNLSMEYRIGMANDHWTAVPTDDKIIINYLPAGDYTLEIRKQAGFGINNYVHLTQQFSVRPFFYETSFFKILVSLLLVTGLYLLYRRRVKYLNERRQKLELLVQQRTKELNKSIGELEQAVADLKISEENLHRSNLLKDKLTSIVLHDLRSPVRFVNLLVNQLYQAVSSGDAKQHLPLAKELKSASNDLSHFTQQFLAWLMSQQAGFKTRNEYLSIKEIFTETEQSFTNMLQWRNNKFIIELKENISFWADKQLLKIVLHNLVDNANKHTENGTILLGAYRLNEELVLRVEDSGSGMPADQLKALQHRLKDSTDLYVPEDSGSLGYTIIKDFVHKLNGHITVDSKYQEGTSVVIKIPNEPS